MKPKFQIPNSKFNIRRVGKKLLLLLLVIAIFIPTYLMMSRSAEAAWFDDNWAYRKAIILTNTTGESSKYATLSNYDASDTSKYQTDCGDVRFTKQNGQLLPYTVDTCDSTTNFHIEFDTLAASSTQTVYIYFGNPTAPDGFMAADRVGACADCTFGSPATEEKAPSPVVYFKLDDGTGTTTQDSTDKNNDGTLTDGPTWQTEDRCVSGKCLYFDGSNDFVNAGSPSNLGLSGDQAYTMEIWVKPLAYRDNGCFVSYGAATQSHVISICSDSLGKIASNHYFGNDHSFTTTVQVNIWQHIAITYNPTTSTETLYVNGVSKETWTPSNLSLTAGEAMYLGKATYTAAFTQIAFLDEVKIYNSTRTATQIKADYNARSNTDGASSVFGSSTNQIAALSNGLAGYWKLDQTSTPSLDGSGYSNSGAWTGATSTSGKFGTGNNFDGVNDKIEIGDANSLDITNVTLSAWINATTLGGVILSKAVGAAGTSGYYMDTSGSKIRFCATGGCVSSTTSLTTGTWTHVAVTYDGTTVAFYLNGVQDGTSTGTVTAVATNSSVIRLGLDLADTGDYEGKIDEARVYSRALTSANIQTLYNFAPGPVLNWKLDENTGTTANDSSGYGNSSTSFSGSTSYSSGKFGSGVVFDGDADVIRMTETTSTDLGATTDSYTVAGWVKTTENTSKVQTVIGKRASGGGILIPYVLGINASEFGVFSISDGTNSISATGAVALNDGKWHHLEGVRDVVTDTLYLYVDGVLVSSASDTTTATTANNQDVSVGNSGTSYDDFDLTGAVDDIKIYNYARAPGQVVEDMNAGHPAPGSPVGSALGHWKFNEGADNTCSGGTNDACNSGNGGSTLDGAETNMAVPATSTSGWTNSGKFGKGVIFDGSNDRIAVTDTSAVDFSTSYSISAWAYLNGKPSSSNWSSIVTKGTTGETAAANHNYLLGFANSIFGGSGFDFTLEDSSGTNCNANTLDDEATGQWYHLTAIFDDNANTVSLYINGILQAQAACTLTPNTNAQDLMIGDDATDVGVPFNGTLDEVKMYTFALTNDQIKVDMNGGKSQILGALSDKSTYQPNAANQEYCVPGDSTSCTAPLYKWSFEENTGQTLFDTAGGAKNATRGTSASVEASDPAYGSGKFGSSLQFDGSDDAAGVSMTNVNITDFTFSMWVYHDDTGSGNEVIQSAPDVTGGDEFISYTTSSNLYVVGTNAGTRLTTANTVPTGQWVHLTITRSGSTITAFINGVADANTGSDSGTITLGSGSPCDIFKFGYDTDNNSCSDPGNYWDGRIDEIRLFDYARSAAQIAWDYNQGKPVAHWRMDECSGTSIKDSSGNSNTGTLTIGASGTYTAPGTCSVSSASSAWYNGVSGKRNYSVGFDGTDDYITIADSASLSTPHRSEAAWINRSSGTDLEIYGDWNDSGADKRSMNMIIDSSSKLSCSFSSTGLSSGNISLSGTTTISTGTWYHGVCTYDGTTAKLYVNGILEDTDAGLSGALYDSDAVKRIGAINNGTPNFYFPGQLDDVRIYNYALTATQVKLLMNEGATRFGPVTGAP